MSIPLVRQGYYPKDDDYYILLDVDFNASQDRIASAYKNLARKFHPDKHLDERSKREAELIFHKIKTAYDVLGDPRKRQIYDTLGPEGLKLDGWQMVRKQMTADEIRNEFKRIQKQRGDEKAAVIAKPRASFTMAVDASEIFRRSHSGGSAKKDIIRLDNINDLDKSKLGNNDDDDADTVDDEPEEEELEIVTLSSFFYPLSAIEMRSLSASMSVDNNLALNHTLTLTGNLSAQNGVGDGLVGAVYRYKYSQNTQFNLLYQVGRGPIVSIGADHKLSEKTSVSCRGMFVFDTYQIVPAVKFSLAHRIRNYLLGKMTYREGINPSLTSSLVYINEKLMLEVTTSLKLNQMLEQTMSIDVGYRFNNDESKLSVSLVNSERDGLAVEYGCETRVYSINAIGASLALSIPAGITLKIRYNRANQEFVVPIYLSDEIHSAPVFYGTMAPLIAYYIAHRCYFRKKNEFMSK